jgi:tetratricopeptide (TPR) repeat protein
MIGETPNHLNAHGECYCTYVSFTLSLIIRLLPRFRCVLELHAISQKISEGAGRFEITMPSSSRDSFLQATHSRYDMYFMLLSNVDTEYSVCSREKDRESIHKAIKDSIGFHGLNRSIYDVISQWIIEQMKSHINDLKDNPLNVVPRMNDLGTILNQMGRHEEALHTLKSASEMYVQVGSVAPTIFGTTAGSVDAQIDRQIVRIYVHLGQYHLAQSHYDALCARGMSRNDHVFSLRHGGRNLKEFCAEGDREGNRHFRESITASLGEVIAKKEIGGTTLSEKGVADIAMRLQRLSKSSDSDNPFMYRSYETKFYMAYYTFLVLEDVDDDEFRAHLQKTFGIDDSSDEFMMLEERISDTLSTIKWKKMAFDHKSSRLPCAHPAVASVMLRLAHAYVDGDQRDLALPLLQQCLPLLRRLPPFHFDIALALLLRAACLAENCDFAAAATDVAEAQSIWENAHTPAIPEVIKRTAKLFYNLFLKMASVGGNPDARGASQFLSVIKEIGSDEARLKKVIINRAWDAEHHDIADSHLRTRKMMPEFRKTWTAKSDVPDALKDWAAKPDLYAMIDLQCSILLINNMQARLLQI